MNDLLVSVMMVAGTFFMFLAGIGVLRMPDLLMRLHATTKAGTLGAGLVMLAVATHFLDAGVTARTLAIILFILLTAPVAAHAIGRAGYFVGVPLWDKMLKDDLKDRYDPDTHILHNPDDDK
ncbi:Na+/H+ antiporter subunit G, partial [Alcanivorax sp. HI0007]